MPLDAGNRVAYFPSNLLLGTDFVQFALRVFPPASDNFSKLQYE